MATRPDDKVRLLVGGRAHEDWESYEVDSDLLQPADAWNLALGGTKGELPPEVAPGAVCELRVGGETVMTGRIDEIREAIDKHRHTLALSGRDGAAVLVDSSAPIFVARQCDLKEVVAKIVKPLGITKIRIDADATRTREKVNVEPGDSAWDALAHAAEANGLWPWFDPDGTLVVGGPDYSRPEVATLVLRRDGRGNNVERLERARSIAERHSVITVLGQAHGTELEEGKHAIRAGQIDPEMAAIAYRPRVVVDHEVDNAAQARDRARKLLADARLKGYRLSATVQGHLIDAPGQPAHGKPWQPGQRVHVISEPHNIDATFFLMARKFVGGRNQATVTELTLHEDGVWVLDAHPHKRKHRRGKNDAIMTDYTGAAS